MRRHLLGDESTCRVGMEKGTDEFLCCDGQRESQISAFLMRLVPGVPSLEKRFQYLSWKSTLASVVRRITSFMSSALNGVYPQRNT